MRMSDINKYIKERGLSTEELVQARRVTEEYIRSYELREARRASSLTQVELAKIIGVSQNRISRMENGDLGSMTVDSLARYINALGGRLTLTAELPKGKFTLT